MPAIPTGLTREQFTLALAQLNPLYAYRFLDEASYEWRGIDTGSGYQKAPAPSDADIRAAWIAVQQAELASASMAQTQATRLAALKAKIASGIPFTATETRDAFGIVFDALTTPDHPQHP